MKDLKNVIFGSSLMICGVILIGELGIINAIAGGFNGYGRMSLKTVLPIGALIAIILFFVGILKCLGTKDSSEDKSIDEKENAN